MAQAVSHWAQSHHVFCVRIEPLLGCCGPWGEEGRTGLYWCHPCPPLPPPTEDFLASLPFPNWTSTFFGGSLSTNKKSTPIGQRMHGGSYHSVSLLCVSRSKRKCVCNHHSLENIHEKDPCCRSNQKTPCRRMRDWIVSVCEWWCHLFYSCTCMRDWIVSITRNTCSLLVDTDSNTARQHMQFVDDTASNTATQHMQSAGGHRQQHSQATHAVCWWTQTATQPRNTCR